MKIYKCLGCGANLQDTDPTKMGFVPEIKENAFCKRCFRMKHYNELPKIVASNEDYLKVIDSVVEKKALMVFIVDIFAFKTTFCDEMIQKLKGKDVILVANKYDVFPKSIKVHNIVTWLSNQCNKVGLSTLAIHIVSSKKGYFIEELLNTIELARFERDVYFVGCANVGKSSLINALLKVGLNADTDVIATSPIPGTTLDQIRIPFFLDNQALIDTPGMINTKDVLNQILPISGKKILPDVEIKPITYQITSKNTICLGGLSYLSVTSNNPVSVVIYASRNLYIHRCKTENLEKLISTQLGKLLTPPTESEKDNIKYKDIKYHLNGKNKFNLWFSGFGFVIISGKCDLDVKLIENTEAYVTNAII